MFRIGFSKIGNFRIFSLPSRMTTQFLSNHKFCEKKDATESIIKKNEESVSNQQTCKKYADKLIKEMQVYLKNEDPAHASENAMQACKSSLIEFVRELENVEPKTKIVPAGPSPWNYKKIEKLCDLLQNRLSPEEAKDLLIGWNGAYKLHTEGWTAYSLSCEQVEKELPFIQRFVEIVNGVPRTRSMADYIKENLFKWNVDTTAEMINKSVSRGKMGQLIQHSNIPQRAELNTCYLQKFGKDLPKVYIENEGGLRTHFSKSK